MQNTDATYRALLAAGAPKEVQAVIGGNPSGGVIYPQSKIVSATTSRSVESGSATIGNCVAKTLNITLRDPGTIPRMARIVMRYRLNDGTRQSSWIPKGTFFIDTREEGNGVLKIVAYDAVLKMDLPYAQSGAQSGWPKTDIACVNEIINRIKVGNDLSLDSRTVLNKGFLVQFPGFGDGAYTMREVLGYIGAMYAGNWVITEQNTLMLIKMGDIPAQTNYLVTEHNEHIIIGGYRILV